MSSESRRKLTIARAMSEALAQEMECDPTVHVLGEDIGALGGVFGTTQGLLAKFGPRRVCDTPISETGFIGAAVGMAAAGLRPVVELMFVDFFGVCMDAIYNLAAKQSYFSGGQVKCPLVLMTSVGGGYGDAGQHSQCLYATFAHLPGLKVVVPADAYQAKGLMLAAIRDDNPVVFMFHKALQGMGWLGTVPGSIVPVPEHAYLCALDAARVVRVGTDVTLVGVGLTVHRALEAADRLGEKRISAEVIDLVTLAPLDRATIRRSVAKTGRLVAVDDDYCSYGVSGEVLASVCEDRGIRWHAAPARISYPDVPVPFSPALEHPLLPDAAKIVGAVRDMVGVPA